MRVRVGCVRVDACVCATGRWKGNRIQRSCSRLVVLAGHRLASAYPLGGDPVAMGRSEAREIVLYDPAARRNHVRVELRAEGYWLIDNQSPNGTYVNGRRVQNHPLSTGDVVRIGSTEFRFELLGALPMPEQPGEAPTIRAPEPPPPVTAPVWLSCCRRIS